jgi:acyl phosphate:glycerol-3-phosphate acyltransferase
MNWMLVFLAIFSFLIGSIPFGFIVAKTFKNIDVRQFGSRNIGATNVGRVIGWKYGFLVLVLDALKGIIPVIIARFFYHEFHELDSMNLSLIMGGFAILGHVYTPFLRFKGGKGVATALGVCLSLVPVTTAGAIVIFFIVYKFSGYVSLGSIIASVSMPGFYYGFSYIGLNKNFSISMFWVLVVIAILILIAHKDNLIRIYQGKELGATK